MIAALIFMLIQYFFDEIFGLKLVNSALITTAISVVVYNFIKKQK